MPPRKVAVSWTAGWSKKKCPAFSGKGQDVDPRTVFREEIIVEILLCGGTVVFANGCIGAVEGPNARVA
jgi:hypothetical protein